MTFQKIATTTFCILFIVLAFCNLQTFLAAGQEGLILISRAVLPILFPFFVLSGLLINLLPVNRFNIIVLSLFSGYPNGARLTNMLYKQNAITQIQAQNLIILTSTASPFFVIATVGIVLLRDIQLGIIIFAATVLGAFANGIIWQKRTFQSTANNAVFFGIRKLSVKINSFNMHKLQEINKNFSFNDILLNSLNAIFNICGIVLICYIGTALLHLPPWLSGIIEMTTGVSQITIPYIICFILSFGGISIALQSFIFTDDIGISPLYYFAFKFTHAVLATGILTVFNFVLH